MLRLLLRFIVLLCLGLISAAEPGDALADAQQDAADLIQQSGVSAGLVVHLNAGDGVLTAALRGSDATQVHGLVADASTLPAIRQRVRSSGNYGDVSFDGFTGDQLPYVDNMVNLLVVQSAGAVSRDEMLRVLVPNGVAMIHENDQWTKLVKPRPDNIDEWSHYLHDASGNSVAHDDVVAPPRHLQWVGSPRWSRHHDRMASMSALVSTGGRMFYIMDEGSRISIQLPPKWKLIARDAFNGSVLWKKDIEHWQPHLWPLKSGPSQLSRRLVSSEKEVFVTLGFDAPLVALDAASGELLRTYEGSDATEEIISIGDRLYLVVRKGKAELADYAPLHPTVGDQARSRGFFWDEQPRVLMAFQASTGKQLWAKTTKISPLTLAATDSQLYFHDGERIVSLDGSTGEVAWESQPVTRRDSFTFNFGPRLVVYNDVVLYAGGDGKMISSDSKSGETLWEASFPNSGYQSPQDLMVVNGLVWLAPLTSGKDSGMYTGRNPRTGQIVKQFSPDVDTYWFHHRCYIAKATDNFLMPSRTGIEFVDPDQEHWDINHWVRGGCLYGVMPCNGLTYAPPHNCACYPEAKLFGFNALAPLAPTRPIPTDVPEQGRLEMGPAFDTPLQSDDTDGLSDDWPTYRHDSGRSGTTAGDIEVDVDQKWSAELGGRLTSPVIAGGKVYVAQVDQHTMHALDEKTGAAEWAFTAGARIDSPPTIYRGRVIFGSADGWVYCLNTAGELAWRYRAAPIDRRAMAYEQLESLWPVHGSVLVHDDTIYCVAGRSNFLDGGLRLLRLDLASGRKLSETIMDETNPETGNNIQEKLQILQMPVGLPDILSSDGRHVFMKSQKFDFDGNRLEIGPNSGDFATQASKQRGPDAHIFAPMGFLDDTWFHRSYWVLGQSFAGGHGGYYQAGRFAPSGRILVKGNGYVYGYGRKPQYLRWTTVLEHQLFAAEQNPPEIPRGFGKQRGGGGAGVASASFPKSASLNPLGKPITIEAWVTSTRPNGVVVARGGPTEGFALTLNNGKPQFHVRTQKKLSTVEGPDRIVGGWHHLVGVLDNDKQMKLYVDGELADSGLSNGLLTTDPVQGLDVGADGQTAVGEYQSPLPLAGAIDEVRLYFHTATAEQIRRRFQDGVEMSPDAVLAVSFDDGTARDHSLHRNNGTLEGGKLIEGKFGKAIQFLAQRQNPGKKKAGGNSTNKPGDSLVAPKWASDVPIYVRGMVLAGDKLFVVGPPDTIDEEQTFEKLSESDPEVQALLDQQDAALLGADGSSLLAVNIDTGEVENEVKLSALPTWDGLAAANGRLFLSTLDGTVICFAK
ncbi:PQQ-binding-like beta-propeller repeat protein [Stieleria sp. TO1_6]|uniref:outer membrane protein assembly factor BamB family protein n=1 Tax=Stieleria tagensis TaxID=2956795 RepID=UPI00209AA05F|nr:PQQ-binding-like beta-propeller repeat protein [Stieleria tagensis]MCO8122924.1 PQQ-binding-like beta-propeller repeat protein [Stieleria tagensis]